MANLADESQELGRLLDGFGKEVVLAENVIRLRQERKWSQDRLAEEMAEVGCPIPQSAISKIEKPAAGGRRAIQVDEALAFAKVFMVPLPELLLPPGAVEQVVAMRLLRRGPRLQKVMAEAGEELSELIDQIATYMNADARVAQQIYGVIEQSSRDSDPEDLSETEQLNDIFYRNVLAAADRLRDKDKRAARG